MKALTGIAKFSSVTLLSLGLMFAGTAFGQDEKNAQDSSQLTLQDPSAAEPAPEASSETSPETSAAPTADVTPAESAPLESPTAPTSSSAVEEPKAADPRSDADVGPRTPLFFPASRNNLQILPQKFEYALMDENTTRIGDILIDASRLTFQILPTKDKRYRLRFTWPAGLLVEGHIILKDSIGKAIVAEDFNPKNIKIRRVAKSEAGEKLRAEIAEYISAPLSAATIEDMKFVPFMTFCVYRESLATKVFLCSKELYLAANANPKARPKVKSRASQKKVAAVEVNRQKVGERGLVFLNDPKENLLFKSFSSSGSSLEIETRRRQIDFKDVVTSEDGRSLLIRMAGTDPVDENAGRKLADKEWVLKIPRARPVLFLKGDGDIPMRQEFLIKGPLPSEKDRPILSGSPNPQTYSSSFSVTGQVPDSAIAEALDKESQVHMRDGNRFDWYSHSLAPNATTRRYLSVNRPGQKQIVGYDVIRGLPFEATLAASVYLPSALFYGRFGFQWWLNNFLGIDSSMTHLRWGLAVEHNQHLTSKTDQPKTDLTNLELMYRFESGFHLKDPTWGLLLASQMVKTDVGNSQLFGVGFFGIRQAPEFTKWMKWYTVKLRYYLPSSGADFQVKQAYQLDTKFYSPLGENFFFTTGLGLSLYKFDPAAAKEENQFQLEAGLSYHF